MKFSPPNWFSGHMGEERLMRLLKWMLEYIILGGKPVGTSS